MVNVPTILSIRTHGCFISISCFWDAADAVLRRGRANNPSIAIAANGSHTHNSSDRRTAPAFAAKFVAPIGETRMGRQGRKYRFGEKGMKKPTPLPPFVMAS